MRRQPHTTSYNIINVKHTKIMKLEKAKQICELWNSRTSTRETATEAIIKQDAACNLSVEIIPAKRNDGYTFFDVNRLADVTRTFGVSSFVTFSTVENQVIAEIY